MRLVIAFLFLFLAIVPAAAEEIEIPQSVNQAIPDATMGTPGTPLESTINVSLGEAVVLDVSVYLHIVHQESSDLIVRLTSPSGTEARVSFIGEGGESSTLIQGWYPGDYTPKDDLSTFFDGEDPNGNWTLQARDYSYDAIGELVEWRLKIEYQAGGGAPVQVKSFSGVKALY